MRVVRRIILWTVLAAIGLMAVLSAIGAFVGSERPDEATLASGSFFVRILARLVVWLQDAFKAVGIEDARALFSSVPLIIFWFVLAALFLFGFVFFRRLVATPAGLAMHLGSLLVLCGAMWGSAKGHEVRKDWLGSEKISSGFMRIPQQGEENRLYDADLKDAVGTLPFSVYLKRFWIEYYPTERTPWQLLVLAPASVGGGEHAGRRQKQIPWRVGKEMPVPFTDARLKVLQYLAGARQTAGGGVEFAAGSPVPAMQVLVTVDGRKETAWMMPARGETAAHLALGNFIANVPPEKGEVEGPDLYLVETPPSVKSYKSDVMLIQDNQKVASKVIEVNDPLHYGGYHFYQNSYDSDRESYSVLEVVSDSGLMAVYLGFFLLAAGTFWRFWGEPAWAYLAERVGRGT